MKTPLYIGLDIGSVSVNAVVIDDDCNFHFDEYIRTHGRPLQAVSDVLKTIKNKFHDQMIRTLAVTGSGGGLVTRVFGGVRINEVVAQAQGILHYYPEVKTIIEMGGEDSKLVILENGALTDFSMNSLCAAGTGSFLDQQAARLKIKIEEEFGELALKSKDPPRIAGRCSVFAKSDMIHLQQIATPDYDVVAGLCFAMARNFKGTIARGRILGTPISFQGGVAANIGMVRAIREVFDLKDNELLIPERYASMGAAGAVITVKNSGQDGFVFPDLEKIMIKPPERSNGNPRLDYTHSNDKHYNITSVPENEVKVDTGYLGIDVGSLSTNVVVIDSENNVLAREYLMTEGRPLEAVCRGLKLIESKLASEFNIAAACTTGSGRYLTSDFIGADLVKNEITCQATAAIAIDPKVDTIFEIGGQDSKYISIDNSVVVDFEMNKACAAGTGSFLQEQAEKLDINIKEEFSNLALCSENPVCLGERCTVFIESDLVGHQQSGAEKDDLVAGLAYSIVLNYLNKVVENRKVGDNIFFQGGVAWNKGVVAAFEQVLGKEITVPPHHDVTGAIGAAILARDYIGEKQSEFKGFGVHKRKYSLTSFTCEDCPNSCHIHKIERESDTDLFYGSRCEKYESGNKPESKLPDTIKARNKILYRSAGKISSVGKRISIPMALSTWDFYPFWMKFFSQLGHRLLRTGRTTRNIINNGCDLVASEACFPIKIAHGHVADIDFDKYDYVFLPAMITMPKQKEDEVFNRYYCPYVQSFPYIFKSAYIGAGKEGDIDKILSVDVELRLGAQKVAKNLYGLGKKLGNSKKEVRKAVEEALECYDQYRLNLKTEGEKYLKSLPTDQNALIVIGRPYNVCDYGANMELPDKIRQLGVPFLSMDFLPIQDGDDDVSPTMYWNYGRKILAAAEYIKKHPNLYAVYLTNFGCGPDSFITHRFKKAMGDKPFLQLEIDEHSADAGFITRIEAFLDHLKAPEIKAEKAVETAIRKASDFSDYKIFIPNMSDHAYAFAAAFRHCGLEAEVLPESDAHTLEEGRKYTSGRECFPAILTTGDLMKMVKSEGFDKKRSAFFMPTADGPCRFGQYHSLHRKILDELGYDEVAIYSPSSRDSYTKFIAGQGDFRKVAWSAFVTVDLLIKMLHHCRPYEIESGRCQKIYDSALNELNNYLIKDKELLPFLEKCAREFIAVEKTDKSRPLVGVVGEIYIRNNRFANNHLISKLEKHGCEVYLATIGEWVLYTTFMYKRTSMQSGDIKNIVKSKLQEYVQYSKEHQLSKVLKLFPGILKELPVDEILDLAKKYISISIGGEAILSIGKGIDLINSGASGIINAMPFTCMPGNIVTALSKSVLSDYPDFPWLNVSYEGLEDTGEEIRLEAFVHQVSEYSKRNIK